MARWVIGAVLTAVLAGAGLWILGVKATADTAHGIATEANKDVAVLKSQREDINRRFDAIDTKLGKMDDKLDRALGK